MIVTCPHCSTRYLIDPRSLGVTGRSVRCTHCSHVWMQLPPEDAPRRVDLPAPGAARPPAQTQAARPAPQRALMPPSPPPQPSSPAAEPPPRPAVVVRPAPEPRQAAAPRPDPTPVYADSPEETVVRGGNRPLVIVVLAAAILALLYYGRDVIVDRVPALEPVYASVGLGAGDPREELEFREVTSNRKQENGRATVVIDGEVANISQSARRVPPLRVTLEDSGNHPITSWTVVATRDRLSPGATVPFHTSIADPGGKTVGASVSFDEGTD